MSMAISPGMVWRLLDEANLLLISAEDFAGI
jgi:hypothetical protein